MRFCDLLRIDSIRCPMDAADKPTAIAELVGTVCKAHGIEDEEALLHAVLDREATRTTGIGNGLAIPHGKSSAVTSPVAAVGKPAQPIDFDSVDDKPANIVVMLISPVSDMAGHIQALARISRLLTMEQLQLALERAGSPEQVLAAFDRFETVMEQNRP